ncbi:MAG: AIR synthase-related protein, partial [Gemmataceae bacterium]
MAAVHDVRKCVTMDLKTVGNHLLLVGETRAELGQSFYSKVNKLTGGAVPTVNLTTAPAIHRAVAQVIAAGLVRACHDLSDGGLAVALAEMAFAGGCGADIKRADRAALSDAEWCFSESPTRYLLEVPPEKLAALRQQLDGLMVQDLGVTVSEPRLRIAGQGGDWIVWASLADLKSAWQKPLQY